MPAATTDHFRRASSGTTRPVVTYLASDKTNGSTTAVLNAVTGWNTTTGVDLVIYRIDTSGAVVAGTQTDWIATLAGSTLSDMTLKAGTEPASGYPAGTQSVVIASPTAAWGDSLVEGILVEHNQDGTHDEALITSRTEDTTPASGDYVMTVDVSASNALKKVQLVNLPITGQPVQKVSTNASAVAIGTTIMPFDDTIPQITEGDQYMTQAITPKSTSNTLVIEANLMLASSTANDLSIALFQDATANALAATSAYQGTANGQTQVTLRHRMTAGTTSSTTFRIRAGGSVAGTTTFNGQGGARKFGGITVSAITITEYRA